MTPASAVARPLVAIVCLLSLAASAPGAEKAKSLSPAEALRAFRVAPGLRVELVAAEPAVVDPVAIAFDERRRLYVVENRGYPDPMDGKSAPAIGRVALLEDRDGDGRYETRHEFATGLSYPNGVLPWRGGVFVTCAPDIFYLKDTDGDGVADVRRVVFTGFNTTRTAQIRVSHPTLGLDGKVYVTSGLNGGKVTSPEHPGRAPVSFTVADGRFDPETLEFESLGGRGQFGLSFDAYGRRFISSNRHPVMQVVLEPAWLRRNPHLAFAESVQNVSKIEAEAVVWPVSRARVTADFIPSLMSKPHSGTFTSASGVLIYGGSGLGDGFDGNAFICESAQNLVQRQVLQADGASFRAEPAARGSEFLASTDSWFRPVSLANGPDGALYVVDMCRREIDHPAYVPEESRGKLDFVSGVDLGRIYRVVAQNARVSAPGELSNAGLVRALESPESWWRELARRLLVERAAVESVEAIERVVSEARRPEARVQALWTLHGLGRLRAEVIEAAVRDASAGVREQALALAGRRLAAEPKFGLLLARAAADADARVRFCAALELGSWADERAVAPLAAIALRDGADRWTRAAVFSGVGGRVEGFRTAVAAGRGGAPAASVGAVMEELGRLVGASSPLPAAGAWLAEACAAAHGETWRIPAVLGLAEGLRGRGEFKGRPGAGLLKAAAEAGPGAAVLEKFLADAAATVADAATPVALRSAAIALLGHAPFESGLGALGPLLDPRQAPELQLQVVRALERAGDARGAEMLAEAGRWSRYTPQVREAAVAALVSKPAMVKVLFAAIERGAIRPTDISSVRRSQLMKHANADVKAAATRLFQSLEGGDRIAVYRDHKALLMEPADAVRGAPVFARACSACHSFRGAGGKVGPDLTGMRNQPADALLLHILVPNYEVMPAYQAITITTQDGRAISGCVTAETDASLTLRTASGAEETVLRGAVAATAAAGVSLMPDGLEQTMTRQELADLIAHLKSEPAQ
ncbi:MAG: PVC-type heme-binding CxxCH protein [Opitutaceae bacterium]